LVPPLVTQLPLPPPPIARVEEVKYSLTVTDTPLKDLLFAMGRDTNVNIDIHPGIEGRVTLNALDQSLKQILTRIAKQADIRFEVENGSIIVMPDSPYLKLYRVDYVNMSRESSGSIAVQTQVVGPNIAGSSTAGGGASVGQNSSTLKVENTVRNRLWETLERNIKDILRETDKQLPDGSSETVVQNRAQGQAATTQAANTARRTGTATSSSGSTQTNTITPGVTASQSAQETTSQVFTFREAASVIVNPETGTMAVRATARQHAKVGEFINEISGSARRQVLIEATVAEVLLNDNYQSGVDWSALGLQNLGYTIKQSLTSTRLPGTNPFFSIQYNNPSSAVGGTVSSTLKLLNSFGTTRVLSSPKLMALNNQTAVMRVVDNTVYFTIQSTVTPGQAGQASIITFSSTPNVVPEGFIMNVTAQISENDIINLNVRPSISRITSYVNDPNPDLARAGVFNRIPQIQNREFETMLRVASGQTTILGGLMQDALQTSRDGLPVLSRVPVLGDAVSYRNDTGRKSELVVFLRVIVVREASIDGDLGDYKRLLPDGQFFQDPSPSIDLNGKK
jgi:MSHA biogenesis protein MshL